MNTTYVRKSTKDDVVSHMSIYIYPVQYLYRGTYNNEKFRNLLDKKFTFV